MRSGRSGRHDTRHNACGVAPPATLPNWSMLLTEAVSRPGFMMQAYRAFHHYSVGNQMLAMLQCEGRGLQPGPVNTFQGWLALGRCVRKGERALTLCMPITYKRGGESATSGDGGAAQTFTTFVYKPRWFVISQTEGEEFQPIGLPQFDTEKALAALDIERIPFEGTDGNVQGYAKGRQIAISPIAQAPHKTFFHEAAHVLLGHTAESDFTDREQTPRNLREAEAESVALLCCESLQLPGAEFCRGYIQHWLAGDVIPEESAQKIWKSTMC